MKYRLKKDLPTLKAGALFTSEMYNRDGGEDADVEVLESCEYEFRRDAIDSFNEWFEEVKEPAYRRQRIKEIHRQGSCTIINYRVIKAFYEMSDDGFADKVREGIVSNIDVSYDDDEINYLNQMIELGFIEVENDNRIVWEDEDEN